MIYSFCLPFAITKITLAPRQCIFNGEVLKIFIDKNKHDQAWDNHLWREEYHWEKGYSRGAPVSTYISPSNCGKTQILYNGCICRQHKWSLVTIIMRYNTKYSNTSHKVTFRITLWDCRHLAFSTSLWLLTSVSC